MKTLYLQPKHTNFVDLIALSLFPTHKNKRLITQIEYELKEKGSLNYWRSASKKANHPLPNDLDDTFLGLVSVYYHYTNKALFKEKYIDLIINLLLSNQKSPGGPYYTWIHRRRSGEWKNIDICVNANIAFLLESLNIEPPKGLKKFLENSLITKNLHSVYYTSKPLILFFLSRCKTITGKARTVIIQECIKFLKNDVTEAERALLTIALSEAGHRITNNLLPQTNSSFKDQLTALYIEKISTTKTEIICTNNLFNKNLLLRLRSLKAETAPRANKLILNIEKQTLKKIQNKYLVKHPEILKHFSVAIKEKIYLILPELLLFYGSTSIVRKFNRLLIENSVATLEAWAAYSIFDDIYDEQKESAFLFLGLDLFQNSFSYFIKNINSKIAYKNIENLFRRVNFSDQKISTLKKNGTDIEKILKLSLERAVGLLVPYSSFCSKTGIDLKNNDRKIKRFYKTLILSKLLLDDAHDFEEDLEQNKFTLPTYLALSKDSNLSLAKKRWYKKEFGKCMRIISKLSLTEITLLKKEKIYSKYYDLYFIKNLENIFTISETTLKEWSISKNIIYKYGK